MPWFRVDDAFSQHPKVLKIPRKDRPAVLGLWFLAGTWCAQQLTDGVLDSHMVDEFGGTARAATRLVDAGLWHRSDHVPDACLERESCPAAYDLPRDAYIFHDWADYQPTRAKVEADRAAARERVAAAREAKKREREAAAVQANVRSGSGEHAPDVLPNTARSSAGVRSTPTRPDPTRPVSTSVAEVHPSATVPAAGATR